MLGSKKIETTTLRMGVLSLALLAGACGHAKRSDVNAEFARLRQEMQQGDETLGARVDGLDARVNGLERDLQALRQEFNVTVQRLEGMLAFNVPVHFGFDSSDVRDQDRAVLDRFAAVVRAYYPNAIVTVEGFADPSGSAAYNLRLGKARAESVKSYLATTGNLPGDNLRTVSYGSARERQIMPGAKGEEGLANRRVALVIDYNGEAGSVADQSITLETSIR